MTNGSFNVGLGSQYMSHMQFVHRSYVPSPDDLKHWCTKSVCVSREVYFESLPSHMYME
jgi:hypothetical protein